MGDSESWLNQKFGKRLKQIRQEESETQEAFATMVGLSTRYYQELESGTKFVSASTLEMLCQKLDRKPKEFFDFERLKEN